MKNMSTSSRYAVARSQYITGRALLCSEVSSP